MSDPTRRRVATREGVPLDEIRDAQSKWEAVQVRIQRRVAGGKLAALGTKIMTLPELEGIESWIKERAGGGQFRVEARDPKNTLEYADPIPPFTCDIEGPPKPSNAFEHAVPLAATENTHGAAGMTFLDSLAPPAEPVFNGPITPELMARIPSWVSPEHWRYWLAHQRTDMVAARLGLESPGRQAPASTFSSDQLAVKQLDEVRADLAQREARALQREKDLNTELERVRKENERHKDEERSLREKAERDLMNVRLEALQRELATLKSVPPAPPPKPALAPEVWVGMATALAPVLVAVVTSGSSRQAALAEQQAKVAELQMTGLSTVIGAANGKKSDMTGLLEGALKLAPLLTPVLAEFFKNKSPTAQANLFSTLMEGNLTTLSTMGSFLQTMMEMQGGDPWWRPMVENGIQGVVAAANQYAAVAAEQNGAKAPQTQAAAGMMKQTPGAGMATVIVNHPQFPKELKNGAWVEVIAALHDKAHPENIAEFVTEQLVGMENRKENMPEFFANVFEAPEQAFTMLMSNLPIYRQDRPYADSVIKAIGEAVRATRVVDTEGEEEGDQGDGDDDAPQAIPFNLHPRGNGARIPVPAS